MIYNADHLTKSKNINITSEYRDHNLYSYDLKNSNGMSVSILNYGATIARMEVPDRNGVIADVLLGHDNFSNYIGGRFYLGATIGRYANRIANGCFNLDGKECQVSVNRAGNLLHGGFEGFDKKFWDARIIECKENSALELTLISHDGEEGFPGTMEAKVIYSVTESNELKIKYMATSNKTTVINLTNHAYFNLTGTADNSILDHILKINADNFTPINERSLPTGLIENVGGTPLDFRSPHKIGERIDNKFGQLKLANGYDHNFVINNFNGDVREAATLYEPISGRFMEVYTNQPGIQFYSGNYLDGTYEGKNGIKFLQRSGLCLECQHFPNSPNEKDFPSVILKPGQVYRQTTIYKFSIN